MQDHSRMDGLISVHLDESPIVHACITSLVRWQARVDIIAALLKRFRKTRRFLHRG